MVFNCSMDVEKRELSCGMLWRHTVWTEIDNIGENSSRSWTRTGRLIWYERQGRVSLFFQPYSFIELLNSVSRNGSGEVVHGQLLDNLRLLTTLQWWTLNRNVRYIDIRDIAEDAYSRCQPEEFWFCLSNLAECSITIWWEWCCLDICMEKQG